MKILKRIFTSAGILVLVVAQIACGPGFATTLRLVVAAGAPILDVLQRQGKITPELRAGLITDLTNEGYRVGDMATCFGDIPKGDPDSKVKHLRCVQTLEQSPDTRKLLSDFGSNPAVQNIADDIDSVLQAALIFYGGSPKPSMAGAGVSGPVDEKEIKRRVEKLKKDLGQ